MPTLDHQCDRRARRSRRRMRMRARVLALTLALGCVVAGTARADSVRALSGEWFADSESGSVVLELLQTGGYGNGTSYRWKLFGDGQVEVTTYPPAAPSSAARSQRRQLDLKDTEALLTRLASAGIPGATEASLLAALREKYPNSVTLDLSEDCATTRVSLTLLHRDPVTGALAPNTTRLVLRCVGSYGRFYPGVKELDALDAAISTLFRLMQPEGAS